MVFWAWVGALMVGLTLGLLGSGGSILTVPVLVYLVDQPEKLAIAQSLGIVAMISGAGALPFAWKNLVHWRSVFFFGIPGMAGTYLGALLSQLMTGAVQLAIFSVVMLIAAVMMFWKTAPSKKVGEVDPHALWKLAVEGVVVGVVTGLVGVGGGFLIIPALVLLVGLPMHLAVGTSLVIISAKSISGFWKYIDVLGQDGLFMDWTLVGLFGIVGIAGSFAGGYMGRFVPQDKLKRIFAVFLVVMGVFILWQHLPGAIS